MPRATCRMSHATRCHLIAATKPVNTFASLVVRRQAEIRVSRPPHREEQPIKSLRRRYL